ncbi:NADH-flavin oxidoreductase/NADH oxidase [Thecamonas trahens ATCC 50062]|uniref:NADH-flavin oxidoreductase/NADH oxidase n=1 Tax=Thecamonas trahens ATCC 50062 TaxID=461836 RepID=A0A0L0DI40_THETB|nr:NADH-flavin oxidoreductase/NADH oxidase [Thecamonas trahens ATCC 50062]KNC50968.1 NADH-flavin oxidoreductase/NADH oxidase [Thecamonas trahens ATCC 50062]|eukprot:XP_013756664.1 NADH-flavin oxidoreductase/NADH oxidase [Thecamonas trahens ATCC 50062]
MSASDAHPLFQPLTIGPVTLPNRIVQAPCTRDRADNDDDRVPTLPRMADHYAMRAKHEFGLLIAEATLVSRDGAGYICTPGIYSPEQIEAWKAITQACREANPRVPFFCQLWHCGRHSHRLFQADGELPVAPSAIPIGGKDEKLVPGWKKVPYEAPREATLEEMRGFPAVFAAAARNSIEAGFDGVEIHSANGYLLDQALRDGSNQRTDEYGGSIENRARLLLETTVAVIEAVGDSKRVGVRLSPAGLNGDMTDSNPVALFSYVMTELDKLNLGYIHFNEEKPDDVEFDFAHLAGQAPNTPIIACFRYDLDRATKTLKASGGYADAIAWGQWQVANPDLPIRFRRAIDSGEEPVLNPIDWPTVFAEGDEGYNTYPTLDEATE